MYVCHFCFQKVKEYERDLLQHQTTIQEKDLLVKQLQLKFDQLTTQLQLAVFTQFCEKLALIRLYL